MSKADDASSAARRKAQELLGRTKQADVERVETEARRRQAEDAKTARLRALRLAKEAAEKAERDAAGPPARRSRRSRGYDPPPSSSRGKVE
jgi:hypothetical protein